MQPDIANLDCWVLAGQSNMEGVGQEADSLPPDERVWVFSSAGNWEIAQDPIHKLWESFTPVHLDLSRAGSPADQWPGDEQVLADWAKNRAGSAAGLGVAFGQAMADGTGRPVGLIPAAHGGTSLEQWNPAKKSEGGHSLYGAMLERLAKAGGKLRGILWYQGCSDANEEWAPSYLDRMAAWVAAARSDTGLPDLPVLVVQIGNLVQPDLGGWGPKWWDMIREALRRLPEVVPHTTVTSAVDLGLTDCIHIHTPGLHRLGRRLARQALAITGAADFPLGPRVERLERAGAWGNGLPLVRVVCGGVTGAWWPAYHISGFAVRTPEHEPHPTVQIITAERDPGDATALRLLLSAEPDDQVRIGYGLGLNPFCNAVDDADMPLPAFWEQEIG
jgi:sialate O-acetylesterase